jgi:hypothetical protein
MKFYYYYFVNLKDFSIKSKWRIRVEHKKTQLKIILIYRY